MLISRMRARENAFNPRPDELNIPSIASFQKYEKLNLDEIVELQTDITNASTPRPVSVPAKFLSYDGHNKVAAAYYLNESDDHFKLNRRNKLSYMSSLCLISKECQNELDTERKRTREQPLLKYKNPHSYQMQKQTVDMAQLLMPSPVYERRVKREFSKYQKASMQPLEE